MTHAKASLKNAIEKHRDYLAGKYDLRSEVGKYLDAIESRKQLNAFITVFSDQAFEEARKIDRQRDRSQSGPLAGLIIAVKDNIAVKNQRLTCGSKILENFISPYSATVVEKITDAGGLIIGKTNLDEFAMGSSGELSWFGPVQNPVCPGHVPGGSSSGSAAALAAGLADLALGSDTGGSVRQPAAFCGVVGLKPGYGRVSRYGLVAHASSLDQIGPMGNSVADVALLLEVVAGHDPRDATCADREVPPYQRYLGHDIHGLKIGLPKEALDQGLDTGINERIKSLAEQLEREGAIIREVSLPLNRYAIAAYYILATAEASSNLARYDGVRYGYRAPAADPDEMLRHTRSQGFGREVKRRIMLGTYVLSAGYYDAYYRKAQQVRRLIRQEYDRIFRQVDLLLAPVTPTPPFKMGEKLTDPLKMYLTDVFTVTANLAGLGGLALPAGLNGKGLPIGIQLLADSFQEPLLIRAGHFVETILRESG